MTLDIHVTVELQPSPQLVELLQSMQLRQPEHKQPTMPSMGETERLLHPGPKQPKNTPQEDQERPPGRPPVHRPVRKIIEVPRFTEFTTDQPVHLSKNLYYAESENGLVMIKYLSGTIYTLWSEIMTACRDQINVKPIPVGRGGNKYTALNQFLKAVEGGLRKGQAKTKSEISNSEFWTGKEKTRDDHKEPVDLDADFRPMLQQNTRADYDGNKLEGSLED
jgi:hypothetical protein